jgi:DNA-binding NarL/FixJ family response regulator
MREIRIAVADDSVSFLAAAAEYIARLPGCVLVHNVDAADVVLLDLGLAPARGLHLVRELRARPNAPAVVAMTLFYSPEASEAARRAGAFALIGKDAFVSGLTETLAALFPAKAPAG